MNATAGNHVNDDSSLSSVAFGKPMRKAIASGTVFLALVAACSRGDVAHPALSDSGKTKQAPAAAPTPDFAPSSKLPDAATAPDFATVSKLINNAIAAARLPGAVVEIGHGGNIAFHQAYGSRKLAGEPGLDGLPAPAEPMTEDTIFDMASLTATADSVATQTATRALGTYRPADAANIGVEQTVYVSSYVWQLQRSWRLRAEPSLSRGSSSNAPDCNGTDHCNHANNRLMRPDASPDRTGHAVGRSDRTCGRNVRRSSSWSW